MTTQEQRALAELYFQRFAFASEDEFYAVWRRLGDVRGRPVEANAVDEKFAGLFDVTDPAVDGAFLDFVSDELKRDASPPDDCSFGEMVRWALENRLSEAERRRLDFRRFLAWGTALAVVVLVVAMFVIGPE